MMRVRLGISGLVAVLLLSLRPLALGMTEGASYRPQPIPTDEKAYTDLGFRQALYAYHQRTMGEAYPRVGKRNPAWDEPAQKLMEGFARFFTNAPDYPSKEELLAQGKALMDLGCDDALVLYLYAVALQLNGRGQESEGFLKRSTTGFETGAYVKAKAAYAPIRLARLYRTMGETKKQDFEHYRDLGVKWLVESTRDGSYAPGEQRIFLTLLDEDLTSTFNGLEQTILDALREKRGTDPYIIGVVGGKVEIALAWEARGSDWASNVTEGGWKGFEQHLGEARKLLTEAWKTHPQFPEAPTKMITVTTGGGEAPGETARMWFDRAVTAQMDYDLAYRTLLWALEPRWGGSYDAMFDLAVECLQTKRFDTLAPWELFRTLDMLTEDLNGDKRYWLKPVTYHMLETLFAGYEKQTADEDRLYRKYRSLHALACWYSGHYDEARRLLDSLGDRFVPEALGYLSAPVLPSVKAEVYAFTGSLAPRVKEAEARYQDGRVAEAAQQYEQILRDRDQDPVAAPYLVTRTAVLKLEAAFASGEWAPLRPDPSLAGWSKYSGDWVAGADGSLTGTWRSPSLWINCEADFGRRLELRGTVDFVSPDTAGNFCVSVARGSARRTVDDVYLIGDRANQKVVVSHDGSASETVTKSVQVKSSNAFCIQLWDNVVYAYLNGELICHDLVVDWYVIPPRPTIALGASRQSTPLTLRFRNLEIRRLTSKPVASEAGAKTR
jgi:hypothetical protein